MYDIVYIKFLWSNPLNGSTKSFKRFSRTRSWHRETTVVVILTAPFHPEEIVILLAGRLTRKAFFISVLARKQPFPACLIMWISSATVAYCTLVSSGAMPSFTEVPRGKNKWWIRRNSPAVFLGTKPREETLRGSNGSMENGPAMRQDANSLLSFWSTTLLFAKVEGEFLRSLQLTEPWKCEWKPSENPKITR